MRITREALLKVVRDTVTQRVRADRSLVSIYLCGSLLEDDFLLGGTTDMDLVLIHTDWDGPEREPVRLTDEVYLDIAHHLHRNYRQTRSLRIHPWLGPTVATCMILHDPQHFMDFTQASVRGQFNRSDFVHARARTLAEKARQVWLGYRDRVVPAPGPEDVGAYLKALEQAVNAVACLSGPPLTERRLLLRFPERAGAVGRPGLSAGLLGLLGAPRADAGLLRSWIGAWQETLGALPAGATPVRLLPVRQNYFLRAFESLLGKTPEAVLWPLLRTWTLAVGELAADSPQRTGWEQALQRLGLLGEGFQERLVALDAYLDQVEETLDEWARANGAALQ